jgi:DNA-binding IclR family transcriptional regulator
MLNLPRTTVHQLLATLLERRYLSTSPNNPARYKLGIRTFELGSVYRARLNLVKEGQYVAAKISALCEETVHLGVMDGRDVTYIAKVDSTHPVRLVSEVGRRVSAHCTAVGKALLAGLSDAQIEALYSGVNVLPALTPSSITSVQKLRREIQSVREKGSSLENCESNLAVACVGAPVQGQDGAVIAAMSISVPTSRWSDAVQEDLTRLVVDGARELSEVMGYTGVSMASKVHASKA